MSFILFGADSSRLFRRGMSTCDIILMPMDMSYSNLALSESARGLGT